MKTNVTWRRNGWVRNYAAGWHLLSSIGEHLGTVFADGSWYCVVPDIGDYRAGSQPLAAQALLRVVQRHHRGEQ